MDELVSIIVPIYNGERYLKECLDSLKVQDYPDIEIIMIDDGSTDKTADICRRYTLEDQRYHYIYQENGGQNAARNTGVKHALGEWVLFVDSDDFVPADYCSSFIEMQRHTGVDMVFGRAQRFQNGKYGRITKVLSGVYSGEDVLAHFLGPRFFEISVGGAMFPVLYRKSIIHDALMQVDKRIRFSEDWACTIFCLCKAQNVAFLSKVVYFYRLTETSYCHMHNKSCVRDQKFFRKFVLNSIDGIRNKDEIQKEIDWLIVSNLLLGGYEFVWDFPGLYPFGKITAGKRIVIYGAGIFGEELHEKFPKDLVLSGWVDKQADYYQSLGKPVSSVKELACMSFDYIVIAVLNPSTADEIENNLLEICIPAEKILKISEQWIDSTYTKNKMQELEELDENYRYVPSTVSPYSGK